MRPQILRTAVAFLFSSYLIPGHADQGLWDGSYSANGQCYCLGITDPATLATIVPTPIGGQSIGQVCKKIGQGPDLEKMSGLFNFVVYEDPQCGNGPFKPAAGEIVTGCLGSLDGNAPDSASCKPAGPNWDLKTAYGLVPKLSAAVPDQVSSSGKGVLSSEVVDAEAGKPETEEASASAKIGDSTESPAGTKPVFSGRSITIDGVQYLQAKDGVSATGGQPGSRIILDDLVFLRDDDTLNVNDLFVKTSDSVNAASKEASGQRSDSQENVNKKLADKGVNKNSNQQKTLVEKSKSSGVKTEDISVKPRSSAQKQATRPSESEHSKAKPVSEATPTKKTVTLVEELTPTEAPGLKSSETARKSEASLKRERSEVTEATSQLVSPEEKAATSDNKKILPTLNSALRLPSSVRPSSREFAYLEALPINYDLGGNGVLIEGSFDQLSALQLIGRIGIVDTYQEVMAGVGYYFTPKSADRATFVVLAGLEHGAFDLTDNQNSAITTTFSDTGFYLAGATRITLNSQFELKAGIGFSSFFEGDATLFGGAYWHLTRQLDLVSRFELGDNDLLGIGIRFYY